jgi:hypothetical protein
LPPGFVPAFARAYARDESVICIYRWLHEPRFPFSLIVQSTACQRSSSAKTIRVSAKRDSPQQPSRRLLEHRRGSKHHHALRVISPVYSSLSSEAPELRKVDFVVRSPRFCQVLRSCHPCSTNWSRCCPSRAFLMQRSEGHDVSTARCLRDISRW